MLDIILLVPILYGCIRGLFRGLVKELTAIIAIVAAIVCAKIFAPSAAQVLMKYATLSEAVCNVVAYLIVFFVVALFLHLIGYMLSSLLKAISLGWLNRLLGAVFGTLKWALIVSVLFNGAAILDDYFHFIKPELKETSIAYSPVKKLASVAWKELQNIGNQQQEGTTAEQTDTGTPC